MTAPQPVVVAAPVPAQGVGMALRSSYRRESNAIPLDMQTLLDKLN